SMAMSAMGVVLPPEIDGTAHFHLPSLTMSATGGYVLPDIDGTAHFVLPPLTMIAAGDDDRCACCGGRTVANLIEMRKMLVTRSGHYDLVVDAEQGDWADNGADEFIRAAQRRLDD